MSDIKWIKLSVNMFDDEKIKLIRTMPEGDSIVVIWVQILCLAGKINDHGAVYMGQNLAYSDEMLSTILGHPLNIMRIALQTLEQFGMIEVDSDGNIDVINWEKHQSTDKMSRIREQNRLRKRKYDLREKARRLGIDPDAKNVPDELEELERFIKESEEKKSNVTRTLPEPDEYEEPLSDSVNDGNVTGTLRNEAEVRSKKLEDRGKKKEVRSKQQEVINKNEEKENNSSGDLPLSKNVFVAWEELWMFPNHVQQQILIELTNLYSDELVVAAIKIAGSKDVIKGRAINFIEAVLKEWEDNNVKDIEQARAYQRNRNNQKRNRGFNQNSNNATVKGPMPDWAMESNDDIEDEEITEESQQAYAERLERLRKMREGAKS